MGFRHSARSGRCLGGVLLVLLLASSGCGTGVSAIGVNYGTVANNLPNPAQAVSLIQSTYISQVKIYDTNSDVMSAFANTGISLVVGARNDEISTLASSESAAQQWVSLNVAPHYPATNIICIVVGNEVISTAPNSTNELVPAMQNLYTGLSNLGLSDKIKVSTPHNFGVLETSYPPSVGVFREDLAGPVFTPMLDFLAQTGSPFMINVYPYFAYRDDPMISMSYALFEPNSVIVDSVTGLTYGNLFDAQVDAAYAAMAKLGHQDITVVVSETGWPSFGDAGEVGVSMTNAQTYISSLLQHVNSQVGTPNRPGSAPDTYIFALYNENQKPGPGSERNFGLFWADGTLVYDVGLVVTNTTTTTPPPPAVVITNPPPPVESPPPSAPTPTSTPTPLASPPPPLSTPPPSMPPPSTPFTNSSPPAAPPPPYTAPPPPYPVPHVPPTGGSTPSPPPAPASVPPPASLTGTPPPPSGTPPPPSFFTPPPGTDSPPPVGGTPPYLPSPPPPPFVAAPSPVPATASPPPPFPPPSPVVVASPPPVPVSPPPSPPAPAVPTPVSPPPASPAPTVPSPPAEAPPGTPPAPPGTVSGPDTWCVAKPGSPATDLSNALNYACGDGGADCTQIQAGASCFNPDTLFSHASYAFSSYYAKNGRNYWNCFFGNSSLITITNPSYAGCLYP